MYSDTVMNPSAGPQRSAAFQTPPKHEKAAKANCVPAVPSPPSFQSRSPPAADPQRGPAGSSRARPFVAGAAGEAALGAPRWMRAGLNIKPCGTERPAWGRDSRSRRPAGR